MTTICYYGDKISPNMAMTPEGFLICRNVPIARTGYQQYLQSELIEDGDPNETVNVYRSPNEVFSEATLASFEGKPVTNGHPDVDVTPANYRIFSKGHVQHVRVGKGDDADKIVADLYITDQELIDEIQNGKREVSAGYYADEAEDRSGRYCQTRIRGNHVAVVDEGRAGRSVCIRDSLYTLNGGKREMKFNDRKKQLARACALYLKDADPSELNERVEDVAEVLEDNIDIKDEDVDVTEKEEIKQDACEDEEPDPLREEVKALCEAVRALIDNFKQDEAPKAEGELKIEDEDGDEDVEVELEDKDVIEDEDGEDMDDEDEEKFIDADESDDAVSAKDAAIKRISRAVSSIKDSKERARLQKVILDTVKGKSQMAGIMECTRKAQAKRDAASKTINTEELQKIYDNLNPHKK